MGLDDRIRNVKIIALRAFITKNEDFYLREVFRWYSRSFSTALHLVPDLPLEDVLLHYFEDKLLKELDDESQHPGQLKKFAIESLETKAERTRREIQEEMEFTTEQMSEDAFMAQIEEEIKTGKAAAAKAPDGSVIQPQPVNLPKKISMKESGDIDTELPSPMRLFPEEPKFTKKPFSDKEMQDLMEMDGILGTSPKKQS